MTIAVFASDKQWKEVQALWPNLHFIRQLSAEAADQNADAIFVLYQANLFRYSGTTVPVFINAVTDTLKVLEAPANIIRFNGWEVFFQQPLWELAGIISPEAADILNALKKKYVVVPDVPGFISARTIAMIINEAYYALEEQVSTKAEIDTALKLGANYPYGPFEWAAIIGPAPIAALLLELAKNDKRYTPSPLLLNEAKHAPDNKY